MRSTTCGALGAGPLELCSLSIATVHSTLEKTQHHTNYIMAPDLNAVAAGERFDYSKPGASGYDIKQVGLLKVSRYPFVNTRIGHHLEFVSICQLNYLS